MTQLWERILRVIQVESEHVVAACPNRVVQATGEARDCWDVVIVCQEEKDEDGDVYGPCVIARRNTLENAVRAAAETLGIDISDIV